MIDKSDYSFIADQIALSRGSAGKAFAHLINMQNDLSISSVDSEETDKVSMRNIINSVYLVTVEEYYRPNAYVSRFVEELQKHVDHHAGSVNGFLKDNGIRVLQDFADISSIVGFDIDIENIR
tara:strand:+ start:6411 stop:6779 length:369 start_codon:yes stop_codon:yes gene_type:complete